MIDESSLVQQGLEHHQRGRLVEAAALYRQVLQRRPEHAEANHLLGLVEHQSGRREEALRHLRKAVTAEPDNAGYRSNLGVVLQSLGQLEEAAESYRRALSLDTGIAAVHNNLGVVLHGLGRHEEAAAEYGLALALEADYAEAHANLGLTLQAKRQYEQAVVHLTRAVELKPRYAKAHATLGDVLRALGRNEEAVAKYRTALAAQPLDAGLHNNLGIALEKLGKLEEALESYRRAIAYTPDFAEALGNLGNLLNAVGRHEDAVASYRRALAIKPENAKLRLALAAALIEVDRYDEAADALRRAYETTPENGVARGEYWRIRGHGCDWHDLQALHQDIRDYATRFDPGSEEGRPATPFPLLAMLDDPALHLRVATNLSRSQARRALADPKGAVARRPLRAEPDKIRLAYLSADFHDHATAYLIAELFEQHDTERFEVHGISFGPPGDSPMRRRMESAFAGFHDLHDASAWGIAQAVAELGIDIAIDLKGYTQGAKTRVFAHRPASIQVQYLGYPGSMGADFIDYLIADPIVIPDAEQRHYAEKIAYLPHCYQVNDRRRPLPASRPSRLECGLPETGFVFAAFNANYKITPEVFSVWMRLLQQVEGSVLWLFESNSWATQNLRAEAAGRGVDPERLIFAKRQPLDQHLARIGNADLFLDTLPYNAHTTASDALWVGLPVLTVSGRSFASRVAASLLSAVGLPELITTSLEDYEALALALAASPARLAALREKLVANRFTTPLFDTPRFTRHIEAAYERMWQLHVGGKPPETFRIEAT